MKKLRFYFSILFTVLLVGSSTNTWLIYAQAPDDLEQVKSHIQETADFMMTMTPNPKVGSVGGEWTVMSLARSSVDVPVSYYNRYYDNVLDYVKEKEGILHTRKYTEYSRVILALTAIGKDPTDVGGYNLLEKLGDYQKVIYQGINGPIFALIAIDSGNYDIPTCPEAKVQATRDMYIQTILNRQIPLDGGFSLEGKEGNPDITAMALQALAPYQEKPEVKRAIKQAVGFLSENQQEDGGYKTWGSLNSESVDQVIMALTALGMDPNDEQFIKNGNTLMNNLMTFYGEGGGFMHVKAGQTNNGGADPGVVDAMATDQGMYAMIAYERFFQEKPSFYHMIDEKKPSNPSDDLNNDKKDKSSKPIQTESFQDIMGHPNQQAIEVLATSDIVSGQGNHLFLPDQTMTRAEFSATIVRALQLQPELGDSDFDDVASDQWYAPFVATAYEKGIVHGISDTVFSPNTTIHKEEALAMLRNAASFVDMPTDIKEQEMNVYLPQFTDYPAISDWARESVAYAIKTEIIDTDAIELQPQKEVTRGQMAQMIYLMLEETDYLVQ